jgi:hypothetical protein
MKFVLGLGIIHAVFGIGRAGRLRFFDVSWVV